ncbi:hypothetical protein N665_1114s0001 [Sinapis alba]|nr:hypothetical protein N665_1114s0001 [Sinapis alba]
MHTVGIVPRYVYTSRKFFSAARLTAIVAKKTESGEFCIDKWFLPVKVPSNLEFLTNAILLFSRLVLYVC